MRHKKRILILYSLYFIGAYVIFKVCVSQNGQKLQNPDCTQKPFPPVNASQISKSMDRKFAYVWYATDNIYLCSALVAMKQLKNLRKSTNLRIDYVLIFSNEDFLDARSKLLDAWVANGGIIQEFEPLGQYLKSGYYKKCLQKFHAMLLFEYSRVIIMDSDGIANHDLDPLFLIPFPQNVSLAAPMGYWFKNHGYKADNLSRGVHPQN